MSDVKAAGAYVEFGEKGLKSVQDAMKALGESVRDFGEGVRTVGVTLMGMGAAIGAPLAASVKQFAEYGKEIGRLSAQTGVSAQLISALGYAGEQSGVGVESIAHAMEKMQRAVGSGSKQAQEAFQLLGVSMAQLKGMSPEEQFAAVADAMSNLDDETQKMNIAIQIFGRSGAELLPMLNQGAAGIERYAREAQVLGVSLGGQQTKNARELSESFHRLETGIRGAALQIGAALMPVLKPLVDRLVDATIAARGWIETNPDFIIGLAKIATTLFVAGGAFVFLGTVIVAAMSPVVAITAAIAGIGMAVLAVTDSLGVTSTGFGELFNSIRVGGTGLGTWLSAFFVWIEKGWNNVTANLQYSALAIWDAEQYVITKIENAFLHMFEAIISGVRSVISAFNTIAPQSLQISTKGLDAAMNFSKNFRSLGDRETEDRAKRRDQILLDRDRKNAALDHQTQQLFLKDPQDNTKGIHIDTSRAKAALETIGGNIWDKLSDAAKGLFGKFNIPHVEFEEAPEHQRGTGKAAMLMDGTTQGTFTAAAAGQLGVGTSIADRIAKATEQTARNTDPNNTRMVG